MSMYNIISKILGIDDTELPNGQIKYLKDVAQSKDVFKINTKNLFLFIEDIVKKHQLENIVLFKKGVSVFASDPNIKQATEVYDLYIKAKPLISKKILMFKDKKWNVVFEKKDFVFVVERHTKPNEIELEVLSEDVLRRLDKVILEEKEMLDKVYNKIEEWV